MGISVKFSITQKKKDGAVALRTSAQLLFPKKTAARLLKVWLLVYN